MRLEVNLFFSLLHFILAYGVFITSLVSNNIKILIFLLILMSIIKFFYFLFYNRCVLTLFEYNDYYPTLAYCMSNVLTENLNDSKCEEVIINIGILILLNKLLFLFVKNNFYNS